MRDFALGLLECSAMASIVILAIVLARAAFGRRLAPAVLLALWALALARLLLPVALPSPVHADALLPRPAATALPAAMVAPARAPDPQPSSPVTRIDVRSSVPAIELPQPAAMPNEPLAAPQKPWAQRLDPWACGIVLWAMGAVGMLAIAAAQARRLRKLVILCPPVINAALLAQVDAMRTELGIRTPVQVLYCDWAAAPMVYGILRPTLFLPAPYLHIDSAALHGVLLHELGHIRHRDLLKGVLWLAVRAAHWFNPLVHVAYRLYCADVELARDALVTSRLTPGARLLYGETLLAAARMQQTHPPHPVAVALLGGSSIGARVRAVLAPRRHSCFGAALCTVLAVMLVLACFTTACQPTPTTPAVVNKNNGKLEAAIKATATPSTATATNSSAATATPTPQPTPTPHLKLDFPGKDTKVTFHVDADLQGAGGPIPVVRVQPRELTMDQVKLAAQVLFEGNTAYGARVGMTKEQIQKQLLKTQEHISDWKKLVAYYSGDEATARQVKEEFTKRIQQYQEMLKTAPDAAELQPTDWTFHPQADYIDMAVFGNVEGNDREANDVRDMFNKSREIRLTTDIGEYHAWLDVYNLSTDSMISHSLRFTLGNDLNPNTGTPVWDDSKSQPTAMTEQQAAQLALQKLKDLGIQDYALSQIYKLTAPRAMLAQVENADDETKLKIAAGEYTLPTNAPGDERPYGYSVTLVRTYSGIPAAGGNDSVGTRKQNLGPRYENEELNLLIQNDRVTSVRWTAPLEDVQVENDNVQTLSQEEVLAAFQKQMQLEYNVEKLSRDAAENPGHKKLVASITAADVTITRAQLVLWRMLIKDQPGQYRMVPVWMFYGHESLTVKGGNNPPAATGNVVPAATMDPTKAKALHMDPEILYLGINALDGSVIDPYAGY